MFVRRVSSAGRAFASHARGRRFESCTLHKAGNDFIPGFFHALIFIYDTFTTVAKTGRQITRAFCISYTHREVHYIEKDCRSCGSLTNLYSISFIRSAAIRRRCRGRCRRHSRRYRRACTGRRACSSPGRSPCRLQWSGHRCWHWTRG